MWDRSDRVTSWLKKPSVFLFALLNLYHQRRNALGELPHPQPEPQTQPKWNRSEPKYQQRTKSQWICFKPTLEQPNCSTVVHSWVKIIKLSLVTEFQWFYYRKKAVWYRVYHISRGREVGRNVNSLPIVRERKTDLTGFDCWRWFGRLVDKSM